MSLPILLPKIPSWIDEVIVVDNNSSDNTKEVATSLGAKVYSETRKDHKGIGYGFAHQMGMRKATGDYIVTMDGDGTYPLGTIRRLVQFMISHEIDFVTCSRFPLINKKAISRMRQLGVWVLNTETQILYGYPMRDILSGMWAMQRKVADKMELSQGGWDFSPEVKLEALVRQDISFAQYHINHHPRDNGASKQQLISTGLAHMLYILRRRLTRDNPIKLMIFQQHTSAKVMKL